jgi:hypothetical protein
MRQSGKHPCDQRKPALSSACPARVLARPQAATFTLGKGLAHQAERAVFEIAQAAVDQLGRRRGGVLRAVILISQQNLEPSSGQVPRDAGIVDATADDQNVHHRRHCGGLSFGGQFNGQGLDPMAQAA